MHTVIFGASLVITLLYVLYVLSLHTGLLRLAPGTNTRRMNVSVVVAVRNEEDSIGPCLDAILSQDYPDDLFEIIIVNDRSEDGTREIIEKYRLAHDIIRLIDVQTVPDNFAPKKYALTQGIDAASGEIICTTDADCVPPPTWVSEMVSNFSGDTGFVAGFSPVYSMERHSGKNLDAQTRELKNGHFIPFRFFERSLSDFLYIDSIGLAAASAGGIGWAMPWTCAGRNLAYRKAAFKDVGGFEKVKHITSGDDDLLMFLVHRKTGWRLRYARGEKAAVPSYESMNVRRFVHQRTRHSSKFFVHPLRVKSASVVVFLFYLAILLYPVYMLISWQFYPVYMLMLGSKFLAELLTLRLGARMFGAQLPFSAFLKAFFIHPPVIILAAILGARGKFTWKERKCKT